MPEIISCNYLPLKHQMKFADYKFSFCEALIHSGNYAIHRVVYKPEYALLCSHLYKSGPVELFFYLFIYFYAEVYTYLYSDSAAATC